jgi:hypothetical protein
VIIHGQTARAEDDILELGEFAELSVLIHVSLEEGCTLMTGGRITAVNMSPVRSDTSHGHHDMEDWISAWLIDKANFYSKLKIFLTQLSGKNFEVSSSIGEQIELRQLLRIDRSNACHE